MNIVLFTRTSISRGINANFLRKVLRELSAKAALREHATTIGNRPILPPATEERITEK